MALKDWKKTSNSPKYIVWKPKEKKEGNHNSISVVVKTEGGEWVTFISAGTFEASSILHSGGTKYKNIEMAEKYMRSH